MVVDIHLLGHFSVRRGGEEIPPAAFHGRLVRTLVRILVTRRGVFVPRDVLIEALWPATSPTNPDLNLNVAINRARRALGDPSLILTATRGYSFAEGDRCVVDAEMFMERVESGRECLAGSRAAAALKEFRAALELWRGEALPEDAYDEWAQEYRSRLSRVHLEALEGAARAALSVGEPGHALVFAEMATQREPLREASHLLVVEALSECGDTAGALGAFKQFRNLIAEELGLDLSPQALELERTILRGEKVGLSSRRPVALPTEPALGELTFVGREEDLQAILDVVQPPVQGIAVVSGPGGAGKSRLLAEVAHHAKVPVVSGRAFQADREEAWALGRILVRDALFLDIDVASTIPERAAQALVDIVPELAEIRFLGSVPLDAESRDALAIQGAASLLEAATSRGATIFVDDLQWADPTTLRLLRELIRRPSRMSLVLAYRPEEVLNEGLLGAFLDDLHQLAGRVVRVDLSALPPGAIARLIDDEKLARLVIEETDRSPLAVTEVVRALAVKGLIEPNGLGGWRSRSGRFREQATRAARAGQRRAVRTRIDHHPPKRRELLGLLALVGREIPARVLAAARRTEQQAILDDLDVLARAGLVRLGNEGWATAHDVIGEGIAEGLERAERGRLHEMLARALDVEDGDPAELARHLLGAGDREAAVEVFAQAARRRLDQFANGEAERLAEAGIQLVPGPLQRSRLLQVRAEARFRRGDLSRARTDFRAVLTIIPTGPERSRVLTRMAMVVSGSEDLAQACELIELALAEAGNLPQARAEALAVSSILDSNTNRLERAEARAAEARALFERLGDAEGVARTLEAEAAAVLSGGRIREVVKMLDRAARLFRDAGMLMRVGPARSYRALVLVWMGQPAQALADAEEALALERMLGNLEGEVLARGVRGHALGALGRIDEAIETQEGAVALVRRLGHREWTSAGLIILGIIYQAADEPDRAEACFRESLEEAQRMPIFSNWAAACLALLLVARGDLAQAQLYVAQAMTGAGMPLFRYQARLARAELAVARGDADAPAIVAEALTLAEEGGHLTSAARLAELARAAATSGDEAGRDRG